MDQPDIDDKRSQFVPRSPHAAGRTGTWRRGIARTENHTALMGKCPPLALGLWHVLTVALLMLFIAAGDIRPAAAQQSDIASTKHNLSTSGSGSVKSTSESQICVFCHTPHAANVTAPPPLWNRELSSATYTTYTSNSLDAQTILGGVLSQPGGSSKLCLSCHDGTMALGTVGVLGGKTNVSVAMSGTDLGKMPAGPQGATSGFTRNLGVNLSNDHPISFTYDSTLATTDGELRGMDAQQRHPVGTGTVIGIRSSGYKPLLPLQNTGTGGAGQVQCTTCHDPHLNASKFLRLNRLQTSQPAGSDFNPAIDQICLGCHDKLGTAWSQSSHASQTIADEAYKLESATLREFPTGTQVWQAACLNCHDTHAVQGTRRLLREGVSGSSGGTGVGSYKLGSTSSPNSVSAVEETCYQCHTTSANSVIGTANGSVPDIKTDFSLLRHMPITTSEQKSGVETHNIKDRNFTEERTTLGQLDVNNRHAECTDCHNPHRVTRNSLFNGTGVNTQRTHTPGGTNGNLASGALRGAFGIEPVYGSRSFFAVPNSFTEKTGDGGQGASTAVASTWVTREYQVCLKCHSDYAYSDDNVYPSGNSRPELASPGTPAAATERNNYTRYTNQAREFQAPVTHQGAPGSQGTDAGAGNNTNNHRSWHPVMDITGRTTALRNGASANSWLAPWNANVGNQTMHCTDCHGNATASGTITPSGTNPWGPHGSTNNFLLKGPWNTSSGSPDTNALCFRCHSTVYANGGGTTGFRNSDRGDLHSYHREKVGSMRCNWCHVAVPHGWKNKSFLVNLNDVGAEAGQSGSKEVAISGSSSNYSEGPYYRRAKLKIVTFRQNSNWVESDCGSAQKTGTNLIANSQGSTSNNTNPATGKDWMTNTCSSPP
ncbi:cytochrome c3 family protein [Aromatoleum diolicum]|nr:cytochrome c3 family protein [Aromatoleum diolicum]